MQCYAITTMHWCTSLTDRQFSHEKSFFANHLMTALLLATDEVHAQSVSVKHFFLKNRFFAGLIIFKYKDTKGLAMINGAAMPPGISGKPSYNTSASTKALMVQHPYQAWLTCRSMI